MAAETLCAIPARGGSKRLPRKNVRPLAGTPMVAYSIEAALDAGFEDVFVCTDDEEIATVAREYGARVPTLMPDELCGDRVPSHEPCQYLADRLADERGREFETLVCLQPTSPLRTPADIRRGLDRYAAGDLDFLMSVTYIDPHYFHWALRPTEGATAGTDGDEAATNGEDREGDEEHWELFFGEEFVRERPDLPDVYRPNGSVKIADLDALAAEGSFFGDRLGTIRTPPERSIHVGTKFDFDHCASILRERADDHGDGDGHGHDGGGGHSHDDGNDPATADGDDQATAGGTTRGG